MSKPIKQCSTCVHFVEPKDPNLCLKCDLTKEQVWRNTGSFCKVYEPSYKYTNADCIRSMTDEELARFIDTFAGNRMYGWLLEWLKKEETKE